MTTGKYTQHLLPWVPHYLLGQAKCRTRCLLGLVKRQPRSTSIPARPEMVSEGLSYEYSFGIPHLALLFAIHS